MEKQTKIEKIAIERRKEALLKNEYNNSNNNYLENFTTDNELTKIANKKRLELMLKNEYNEENIYNPNDIDTSGNI